MIININGTSPFNENFMKGEKHMKVISKNSAKKANTELKNRAVACEPHAMCPKCLKGRG